MTPRQIALVQQSWALVSPSAETISLLFQQRLSKTAPELTRSFGLANGNQANQLLGLFNTAIATLDLVDNLTPALRAIGQRLKQDGIGEAEVSQTREALLWTILRALPDVCEDTRLAWREALEALARVIFPEQAAPRAERQTASAANPPDVSLKNWPRQLDKGATGITGRT